jgi:hypothetical protein
MLQLSEKQVDRRLRHDNPWWETGRGGAPEVDAWPRRDYFAPFAQLVRETGGRRAVALMGPRRVGKTVMLHQEIAALLADGVPPTHIVYLSLDVPLYSGQPLEHLLRQYFQLQGLGAADACYVFFDEVQYLMEWEGQLQSLVDSHRHCRFIACGSAAAALRLKGVESGAGRCASFLLPPLTFAEYLRFIGKEATLVEHDPAATARYPYRARDVALLNEEFLNYLNHGGFPEAVFAARGQADPRRYGQRTIPGDLLDQALIGDLPSLYGIQDSQELYRLFNVLAYNTGHEVTLEALSQGASVAKNTLSRYLEYLEAAFLIHRIHRVDQEARPFQRATSFKVYLTNPSLRAALFGPLAAADEGVEHLAETAVFSQGLHRQIDMETIHFSRWKGGKVDMVSLDPHTQRPRFVLEVKWSDRAATDAREVWGLLDFCRLHKVRDPLVITRAVETIKTLDGINLHYRPASLCCYTVGKGLWGPPVGVSGPSAAPSVGSYPEG